MPPDRRGRRLTTRENGSTSPPDTDTWRHPAWSSRYSLFCATAQCVPLRSSSMASTNPICWAFGPVRRSPVAQMTEPCRRRESDPDAAIAADRNGRDRRVGQRGIAQTVPVNESPAVEPEEAGVAADPQIPVAGLGDGVDGTRGLPSASAQEVTEWSARPSEMSAARAPLAAHSRRTTAAMERDDAAATRSGDIGLLTSRDSAGSEKSQQYRRTRT